MGETAGASLVLRVVLATPAWSLNGPNVFTANLALALRRRGADARIVITRPDWKDPKPMPPPDGIELQPLPLPGVFLRDTTRWRAMRTYLADLAPCVYLPNHDFSHSCISPVLPPEVRICGILHADDPQHYAHAARLGEFWDAIVCVSPEIHRETAARFPALAPRLRHIPYGVPMPAELAVRKPAGTLRAIYAGRLDQPQKRVLDLPAIVRAALARKVNIELTVAGSGPQEAALRQACADLPVRFAGTLGRQALSDAYASHDVFLLPSAFEGLPLSLLEAMAHGCVPVVSHVQSGVAHAVSHQANGFLLPVGDVNAFAACLETLAGVPGRVREIGARAYETIRHDFHVDVMAARYLDAFGEIERGAWRRPQGPVRRPPETPLAESLPGWAQWAGHHAKRWLGLGPRR